VLPVIGYEPADVEARIDVLARLNVLRQKLKAMSRQYQLAWLMIYADGKTEAQIAKRLQVSRRRVRDIKGFFKKVLI